MEFNDNNSLIDEITADESVYVSGGAKGNFDIDTYTFIVGGGAAFGAKTEASRDYAFQQSLSSKTGGGSTYVP